MCFRGVLYFLSYMGVIKFIYNTGYEATYKESIGTGTGIKLNPAYLPCNLIICSNTWMQLILLWWGEVRLSCRRYSGSTYTVEG